MCSRWIVLVEVAGFDGSFAAGAGDWRGSLWAKIVYVEEMRTKVAEAASMFIEGAWLNFIKKTLGLIFSVFLTVL